MTPNPLLGVFLHSVGGLAAASFYVPYRRVKGWAWETFWLVGGLFSWLVAPWVVALLTVPDAVGVLREAPASAIRGAFVFGVLWGVGGLTFGLSMRYLGIALGYAIALGFCAAFGTLVPPIVGGKLPDLLAHAYGLMALGGVAICLLGIAISGAAGRSRERETPADPADAGKSEFNFGKGVLVATFSGILSASMSYAISAGKPIAEIAVKRGVGDLWQNTPSFIIILAGGLLTNAVWCAYLSFRNKSYTDFAKPDAPAGLNVLLCALAGITWYLQFMFYGMGTTQMGKLDFASWTLHMAFIIIFSTLWGIALKEWKGSSVRTKLLVAAGLAVLILSTVVVGHSSNMQAAYEKERAAKVQSHVTSDLSAPGASQ